MARTAITPATFVVNGTVTDPTGTATTGGAGNGVTIAASSPERTILRVANASGGTGTVTVKAGTYPPAIAAGQGDLVISVPTGTTAWIGPLESGRFIGSDGSLSIDTSVVMTVTAIKVNRH